MTAERSVYLVDGLRTPFLKMGSQINPNSAADMGVMTLRALLLRNNLPADAIESVITGCVMQREDEANISRIIALRALGINDVPAYTVARNCASGLQSIDNACQAIANGSHDLIAAGGVEVMSRAPIMYPDSMSNWLLGLRVQKKWWQKLWYLFSWRPRFLSPVFGLEKGLSDATVGMNMGQTAEELAYKFGIDRVAMDEFAWNSHQRAEQARLDGNFAQELLPIVNTKGVGFSQDTGIRAETSLAKLAQLKPVFEKFGLVTAGNSSQITDGAAYTILASEDAVQKHNLPVLAELKEVRWAALDPRIMGLGPALAIGKLLQDVNLTIDQIDYFEINEAFAGQVLACIKALEDPKFCKEHFKSAGALGKISLDKLNIDGGAIALGHPVGVSGTRLTLHLARILQRKNARYGIASLCIGGGQGGAILIENITQFTTTEQQPVRESNNA